MSYRFSMAASVFYSYYDITKHPNYKYLSDYDKKNTFNIERFLSTKLKLWTDEENEVFAIDVPGEEAATAETART